MRWLDHAAYAVHCIIEAAWEIGALIAFAASVFIIMCVVTGQLP